MHYTHSSIHSTLGDVQHTCIRVGRTCRFQVLTSTARPVVFYKQNMIMVFGCFARQNICRSYIRHWMRLIQNVQQKSQLPPQPFSRCWHQKLVVQS